MFFDNQAENGEDTYRAGVNQRVKSEIWRQHKSGRDSEWIEGLLKASTVR
jgi:hypothetical protein